MSKSRRECTHLNAVKAVSPTGDGCEECLAIGDSFEPGEDWSWCFIDEIEVFPA